MLSDERPTPSSRQSGRGVRGQRAGLLSLDEAAADLYADLRSTPFLRRLLVRSGGLLGAAAGSISLVDTGGQRYHKVAERGALCQLGHVFSLDEGVTGRVVARQAPVVLGRYGDVAAGHLPVGHPARAGSVLAVPIWWRGRVIGVNVGFAGRERSFSVDEVDALESLSQLAATGIVHGGATDPTLAPIVRPAAQPSLVPPQEVPSLPEPRRTTSVVSPFTGRERQVAALLARGMRDRDIARTLVISPRTVEKHVAAVIRKTGAGGRTAAVLRCVAEGWVPA